MSPHAQIDIFFLFFFLPEFLNWQVEETVRKPQGSTSVILNALILHAKQQWSPNTKDKAVAAAN